MTVPPRRRWRRRLVWLLVVVLGLRLALAIALPWLVALGAGFAGLDVKYRAGSLSLLGASLQLEDVVVRDAHRPELAPLVRCQQLLADLDATELLRGTVHVVDVAVTGAVVAASRGDDGALLLPWPNATATPDATAPAPSPAAAAPPAAPDFTLPFRLDSARVHNLRLELRDAAAPATAGPIESWLLDVAISDLGWPDRQGRFEARFHDPRRLDHLMLAATLSAQTDRAKLALQVLGKGVRLQSPLFDQLREPFTHRARLADVELQGSFEVAAGASPGQFELRSTLRGHVDLDGESAATLEFDLGPCTPREAVTTAPFALRCSMPGMIGSLGVSDGELELRGDGIRAAATLAATGITLDPVRAWLRQQGVDWPKTLDASVRGEVTTRREGDAEVLDATIRALSARSGDDIVTLPRLEVRGLRTGDGGISVREIAGEGPSLRLLRRADGGLQLAGVRLVAPTSGSEPTPAPGPSGSTALPKVAVAALRWQGLDVAWRDETFEPAAELRVPRLDLTGQDLAVGSAAAPGTLQLTANVPGIAEQFEAALQLRPAVDGAGLALQVHSRGTSLAALRPWLDRAGVQIGWRDAALRLGLDADLQLGQAGASGHLRVTDVGITDEQTPMLQLANAELEHFAVGAAGLVLGITTLRGLDVRVARLADGALDLAGLRLPGSAATNPRVWQIGGDARIEPTGPDAHTFNATLAVAGAVAQVQCSGTLRTTGTRRELDAALAVRGISGSGLGNLLPAGTACVLTDGAVDANLTVQQDEANGALTAALRDVTLRDGSRDLVGMQSARLQIAASSASEVHVQAVEVRGVTADLRRNEQGLVVAGLELGAAAPPTSPPVQPVVPVPGEPRPTASVLPGLRIDAASIEIAAVRFHDDAAPQAEPIEATLRLDLTEPWRTASDKSQSVPMRFSLRGAAQPLLGALDVAVQASPFAMQPLVELQVQARAIDTTAIARIMPSLADRIVGTAPAAALQAKILAEIDLRRRNVDTFDFSRPFGIDLRVENARFGEPDQEPFFSIPEAEVLVRALDPATGELLVQRVEFVEPFVRAAQTPAGIEVAGVRLVPHTPPATPPPPPAAAPPPGPDTVIDRVHVQGLRLDYRDTTTTPPTLLPIADLDLDVRGFTTRALRESVPISFSLDVAGGDVELERRIVRSSVVSGVIGSAGSALALGKDEHQRQARPMFGDIVVRGRLALVPVLEGEVHARVDSFELPAIRGLAAGAKVDIADGLLDLTVDAELHGTRGGVIRATPVFSMLSISEPPGGPISTYLRLPAPLDTVLFLLRNEDGEHRLPFRVVLDDQYLQAETIRDAAVEAIALLLGQAVGGTPMRALRSVTDLFGLTGSRDPRALDTAVTFPTGETTAPETDFTAIVELLTAEPERRVILRHEPSTADRDRAAELASPEEAVVRANIQELRRQRQLLLAERGPVASSLAARLVAGRVNDTVADQRRLAALDLRLGDLEATLDEALQMLERGTSSAADRRTREALRDLGEARMQVLRSRLCARLGEGAAARIELRTPRTMPRTDELAGGRVLVTVR